MDENVFDGVLKIPSALSIEILSLNGNSLHDVYVNTPLESLLRISIARNKFESLPVCLSAAVRLKSISGCGNNIRELPTWIVNLHELQECRIDIVRA